MTKPKASAYEIIHNLLEAREYDEDYTCRYCYGSNGWHKPGCAWVQGYNYLEYQLAEESRSDLEQRFEALEETVRMLKRRVMHED